MTEIPILEGQKDVSSLEGTTFNLKKKTLWDRACFTWLLFPARVFSGARGFSEAQATMVFCRFCRRHCCGRNLKFKRVPIKPRG